MKKVAEIMSLAEPSQHVGRMDTLPDVLKGTAQKGRRTTMTKQQAHHVRRMLGLILLTTSPLPLMAQTATPPASSAPDTRAEEPILPDDQFEARLPKVEGSDPAAPLPSIDSWIDQQMPAQSAIPAQLPPSAEPAPEPELAQPLPPLGSVTVPANEASQDDPNAKLPEVRYATRVEGFDETGLEDEFRAESALFDGDGALDDMMQRQLRAHGLSDRLEAVVLDIWHASEYVWDVGTALYGERNPRREAWVEDKLRALLHGKVGRVMSNRSPPRTGSRRLRPKRCARPSPTSRTTAT